MPWRTNNATRINSWKCQQVKVKKCVIEINTLNAHFKGFMHLGELFFFAARRKSDENDDSRRVAGEYFYIFLMHRTASFDSFSIRKEILEQRREQLGKKIQKEKHLSTTLAGFSITLVDRLYNDCVELLHTSIDDVCATRT